MNKKVLCLLLVNLFLLSVCQAKNVSPGNAAIVAEKFLTANGFPQKKLVLRHHRPSGLAHARSQSAAAPAYYFFTVEGEGGFVVVSGDDIARPILGYSVKGTIEDDSSLPPNMQAWLDDMEQQIQQARDKGVQQCEEIAQQWKAPTVGRAMSKLQTALWGQGYPYNQQCPYENNANCVAGCVATSQAILMKYYGYPSKGRGTTSAYTSEKSGVKVPSRNLEHPYNWDLMPMEYKDGQFSQEQGEAVAELMADIGAAIKSKYSEKETSANSGHAALFAHFGFNPGNNQKKAYYPSSEWNAMLKKQLDMSRPVLYSGASASGEIGHSFILEGYTNQDYYYINWGWNGYLNGPFTLDALNPGNSNYSGLQNAYFDCVPANMLPTVAIVNDTEECPSLKAAFSLALLNSSPIYVTMVKDTPIGNERIEKNESAVLDINGCNLEIYSFGLNVYGNLRVVDKKGNGKIVAKKGNDAIFSNYGVLDIENGVFVNEMAEKDTVDYRRCVWSEEGTTTTIKKGTFSSPIQTLCFNGDATIENGTFTVTGNSNTLANYNTKGKVTVLGGEFMNICPQPDGDDYRRSVWTKEGTTTIIKNGTFVSPSQTLCFNGDATIENGEFKSTENNSILANFNTKGKVTVLGGSFINIGPQPAGNDYRRCVWTKEGTTTIIKNGSFSAPYMTLCFNGDATIEGGVFETAGNTAVLTNYNTNGQVNIKGGSFTNAAQKPADTDYRRAMWTTKGSSTYISGGVFTNSSSTQTMCFNGNAVISAGVFENKGEGYTCLSNAEVTISNCMMGGSRILYVMDGAALKCSGGLYSKKVEDKFLAQGCQCYENQDVATKQKYPYQVANPVGIETPQQSDMPETYYNINGMVITDTPSGLVIVRKKDGKTEKRYYRK